MSGSSALQRVVGCPVADVEVPASTSTCLRNSRSGSPSACSNTEAAPSGVAAAVRGAELRDVASPQKRTERSRTPRSKVWQHECRSPSTVPDQDLHPEHWEETQPCEEEMEQLERSKREARREAENSLAWPVTKDMRHDLGLLLEDDTLKFNWYSFNFETFEFRFSDVWDVAQQFHFGTRGPLWLVVSDALQDLACPPSTVHNVICVGPYSATGCAAKFILERYRKELKRSSGIVWDCSEEPTFAPTFFLICHNETPGQFDPTDIK